MNQLLSLLLIFLVPQADRIPINANNISLTEIGSFGIERKARIHVPAHLHTGIDIKRPNKNYNHARIYPIARGRIISKREDGPYAQLIIEHSTEDGVYWTLYEHIAEIRVNLGDEVDANTEIARFFNREELGQHGWQFDHFHFEVLKEAPIAIAPTQALPDRFYKAFTLTCFSYDDLMRNYYDPMYFLEQ